MASSPEHSFPASEWLTPDERQLGDWATDPMAAGRDPSEFWQYVRNSIPGLLNTIASLRAAAGVPADQEGLVSSYE